MSLSLLFFFAALLSMVGVLFSLMAGLWRMSREGEDQREKSNKMMQLRIWLQGGAILFLLLSALSK